MSNGVVFRPARNIVEVTFSATDEFKARRGVDLLFRVFVDTVGNCTCIGALLDDGTPAEHVAFLYGQDPVDAATQYMQTQRIFGVGLIAEIRERTDVFEVYYGPEDDNTLGGDYVVYMLDSGIVIRVLRCQ